LLIAVPVLNSMCRIFDTSTHLAFFLAPSILGLWIVSRPLLVWYRLQEVARNKGGVAQMIYFAAMLVTVVLGVLWLIACSVTIFFSLGVDSLKEALVVLPLSILSAGVFARLIFEIFVWRVRRNHIDWMRTF